MVFTSLNYWFDSLQSCLTIYDLLEVTSTQEETMRYFEREGRDAIMYALISHEIPAEKQYKRFKEELEENVTLLANNDLRAKKLITLLRNKLEKLQTLTNIFFNKIGSAYNISQEELNRQDQRTAFEYLAHDIRIAALPENDDRDPTQQELLELRNDLIYYLFVAVRHTSKFLSDYLIVYDQEPADSAGQDVEVSKITPVCSLNEKIHWGASNRVLYDLFAQLTLLNGQDGTALVSNSIKGLAQILSQTVEGLPTAKTIEREIEKMREGKGEERPQRGRIELVIRRES